MTEISALPRHIDYNYFEALPLFRSDLPASGEYWGFSGVLDTLYTYFNQEALTSYATTIQEGLATVGTHVTNYWSEAKVMDTLHAYFNQEALASYAATAQEGLSTAGTQIAHYWNASGVPDALYPYLNQEALASYATTAQEGLSTLIQHPAFFSVVLPALAIMPFAARVLFSQIQHPRARSCALFMRKPIFTVLSATSAGILLTSQSPLLFMLGVTVCGCQASEAMQKISGYLRPKPAPAPVLPPADNPDNVESSDDEMPPLDDEDKVKDGDKKDKANPSADDREKLLESIQKFKKNKLKKVDPEKQKPDSKPDPANSSLADNMKAKMKTRRAATKEDSDAEGSDGEGSDWD